MMMKMTEGRAGRGNKQMHFVLKLATTHEAGNEEEKRNDPGGLSARATECLTRILHGK